MQTFVNLDDMLGYLAQFVFGRYPAYQCLSVHCGRLSCELLQFGDRHSQFMCEPVEYNY